MTKAYAVSEKPLNRSEAYSPKSASWTLYNPKDLAEKLGIGVEVVDKALEETGFNKSVRIREEVIRYKERLRLEQKELTKRMQVVDLERNKIKQRSREVAETLTNIRNILRIKREA